MTTRRLAGLTLGAFALLLVARPPRPSGVPYDQRHSERASDRAAESERAVRDTLFRVNQAILLRDVRDSAARQLARVPARALDQIIVDPRLAPSLRAHMQDMYALSRANLGRRVALPLIIALDSLTNLGLVSTMWVNDTVAGTPICATVVRVHARRELAADSRTLMRTVVHRLGAGFPRPRQFALCSFEATFGPPSPTVRRWMAERAYYSIASGYDPTLPPPQTSRLGEAVGDDPRWIPWWAGGGENGEFGVAVRACIFGRMELCSHALESQPERRYSPRADFVASDWAQNYWWAWRGSPILMNELARALGPEKFSDLWKADTAPFESYRRLTGVTADSLSRRLLAGDSPIRLGAAPTLQQGLAALLIVGLFAGLSLLSHPRRRS